MSAAIVDDDGAAVDEDDIVRDIIRNALDRSIVRIVDILSPDVVLDQFLAKNSFGDESRVMVRDIREAMTTSKKNRAIYTTVSRDPRRYTVFKDCLAATRQADLLDVLEKAEEDVHAEMKANEGCSICTDTGACKMMASLRCNRDLQEYVSPIVGEKGVCLNDSDSKAPAPSPVSSVRDFPSDLPREQDSNNKQNKRSVSDTDDKNTQNHLISLYNRHCQKVPVYPLTPEWREHVEKLYVKPSMTEMKLRGMQVSTDQSSNNGIKLNDIREIFYSGKKSYRDVYLVAESGSGKSTLCEFLVYLWVREHSATDSEGAKLGDTSFMEDFEFLFYISLREANRNSTCDIEDMIRTQLDLESVDVSKLLSKHKCLIILDGLDEYSLKHSRSTTNISANLPWRRTSDNCTILTTSRPWKMELLAIELGDNIDRQIRIIGLETKSQKDLAENVITLLNSEKEQNKRVTDFIRDMTKQKLDKYMKTPILLMQMLGLWFDGESFGKSQCEIYGKMIEKQIQFTAEVKKISTASSQKDPHNDQTEPKRKGPLRELTNFVLSHLLGKHHARASSEKEHQDTQLPACFNGEQYCQTYQGLLLKLSKLAYYLLFGSNEIALVFDSDQMEIQGLSKEEIQSCLDLGLLTQYKVLGKITKRQKSISFVHKSHQEFFAAICMWQTGLDSGLKQLLDAFTDLDRALQIEKVFMFVSGMNTDITREIAKVILARASADSRVKQYRESSLSDSGVPHESLVKQIQSVILAGIEESNSNRYPVSGILLQDLWMSGWNREFRPSRILACTQSLDLAHLRSIYIHKSSVEECDEVGHLFEDAPQQLIKLVLSDCKIHVPTIQKVVERSSISLKAIGIYSLSNFSLLDQATVSRIMSANSLTLDNVQLTREQVELVYKHLGLHSHTDVMLSGLHCYYHEKDWKPRLDLSASRELRTLKLCELPLQDIVFVPDKLLSCEIVDLPDTVATGVIRGLAAACSLEKLVCHNMTNSTAVNQELMQTLPNLDALKIIELYNIDMRPRQQHVFPHYMETIEFIQLDLIKMTSTQLRQLLTALPSHRVIVTLSALHLTIVDYDNILDQIKANRNIEVTMNMWITDLENGVVRISRLCFDYKK